MSPSRLAIVQSLWAMEDLPATAERPWSLREQLEQLVAAGFERVALDMGARRAPTAAALTEALDDLPLETVVFTFAGTDAEVEYALQVANDISARDMVLCARYYSQDLREAADTVSRWHERAQKSEVELQLETHRNTLTNDLRFTSALMDELDSAVTIALDLSHYIVGAELPESPTAEAEEHVQRIIARAGSVQGRIATRTQVQIPVDYPGAATWTALAERWWRDAFRSILRTAQAGGTTMFVTELGTTPYALVDMDGRELSDRWTDALHLASRARTLFDEALASTQADISSPRIMTDTTKGE